LAHSSVCQGSHTLAHPSDLRLGKGCKTLLSLSLQMAYRILKGISYQGYCQKAQEAKLSPPTPSVFRTTSVCRMPTEN